MSLSKKVEETLSNVQALRKLTNETGVNTAAAQGRLLTRN
jgi:hypothetical protein